MILLIDNYDSFTFNLARYLARLQATVEVVRNDDERLSAMVDQAKAIVISPGPCGPEQAGRCISIVQQWTGRMPMLGICLGHQVICHALGGKVIRASRPVHGQAFPMDLVDCDLFRHIPTGTSFARYHSLIADDTVLPNELQVIATCKTSSSDGTNRQVTEVMAVRHRVHPTFGVQFHPESILSQAGYRLLANFLEICGEPKFTALPNSDLVDQTTSTWHREPSVESEHTAVLPQY